ncbi:MAG: ArsR/SmtB family transcription factor [Candidatus Eiseniibacteriota bacterium]
MDAVLRPLKAVADASRLRILAVLSRGTFSVAELTEILGIGQSTVSKHLRVLADAGLVAVRRAGTWSFCSLPGDGASGFDAELLALIGSAAGNGGGADAAAVERVLTRRRSTTSEFFRKTAGRWDRVRDEVLGPPAHLDRLVHLAGTPGTVVDLGTGTGVLLPRLAKSSRRVIGVDASPEMLDEARRRADEGGLENADLRLGALEHLPLSDGEADTMVANLVLHHVADPPAVLREIRRGLAPDGRLIIAELGEHADEAFWRSLGARWPGFRPADLGGWLEAAGFSAVRTEKHGANGGRPTVFLMEARRNDVRNPHSRNRRKHG